MLSSVIEERWSATTKHSPGDARPQIVSVSKDEKSLRQHAADLADINTRATYDVVPVMVVGFAGIQIGDEVRVATPRIRQESTGHVTDIRDGIAKIRYGSRGGTAEVPVKDLQVVSRWVRFEGGSDHGQAQFESR